MASSLGDLRQRIDSALHEFLTAEKAKAEAISARTLPLIEVLESMLHRGKRIRAALCVWGYELGAALGGLPRSSTPGIPAETSEEVIRAAASLELLHAAALIHDDLMDDSDTRRGLPAAHRRFTGLHSDAGLVGDAERFGMAGALLAGDLCLGWSEQLFAASGLGRGDDFDAVRRVRDQMRSEVMIGQYLDMLGQMTELSDEAEESALVVVRYKSAKYTIEHPLLLGAALAGASEETSARLSEYGLPLGEAFQLRDDLLGVFGDPERTGKPAGDDLREGKRTVLVAYAAQAGDPEQRRLLHALLGSPDLDATGVQALRDVLRETGAVDRVEELIAERTRTSREALDVLRSTLDDGSPGGIAAREAAEPVLETLDAFVGTVTDRTS